MQIKIDEEFRDLLPPLSGEELSGLEASMLKEGCRDKLIVWSETGILLDGHNRHKICEDHHITYKVDKMSFATREEAMDWIDSNQASRRNLTQDQLRLIRGRRYNRMKNEEKFKGNQHTKCGGGKFCHHQKTAETLAEEYGVSPRTIRNDAKFAKEVEQDRELKEAVKSGRSARKVKKERKKAKREKAKAIYMTISPYGETTLSDPTDPGSWDLVGFDGNLFSVIGDILKEEI